VNHIHSQAGRISSPGEMMGEYIELCINRAGKEKEYGWFNSFEEFLGGRLVTHYINPPLIHVLKWGDYLIFILIAILFLNLISCTLSKKCNTSQKT